MARHVVRINECPCRGTPGFRISLFLASEVPPISHSNCSESYNPSNDASGDSSDVRRSAAGDEVPARVKRNASRRETGIHKKKRMSSRRDEKVSGDEKTNRTR